MVVHSTKDKRKLLVYFCERVCPTIHSLKLVVSLDLELRFNRCRKDKLSKFSDTMLILLCLLAYFLAYHEEY